MDLGTAIVVGRGRNARAFMNVNGGPYAMGNDSDTSDTFMPSSTAVGA